MKIVFLNSLYSPYIGGGAELTLADLATGVKNAGHDVTVVTLTPSSSIEHDIVDGTNVTRLPFKNIYWHHKPRKKSALARACWHIIDRHNSKMATQVRAIFSDIRPDVISFHNLAGFSSAVWDVAAELNIRAVQVLHDYYNICPKSQLYCDGKICMRQCLSCRALRSGRAGQSRTVDAVVGVSDFVLAEHLRHGLFRDAKIKRVIYNARNFDGADLVRKVSAAAKTFGFIGTVAHWKGIEVLLEAFSELLSDESFADATLLIGGTGEPSYFQSLLQRFSNPRIKFLGHVNPSEFMKSIDVAVIPSLWHEPLGGVVFEAMLHSTPVIGAKRGGIPEMISEGVNGLLFNPDDALDLKRGLLRMKLDHVLFQTMAGRAKYSAEKFNDVGRMINEHLEVYFGLTDKK